MSVIGSNILAGASGQAGYNLTNSLRFRSSASAYLNRTPASATNQKTWTWSGWVKRGTLGTYNFGLIFCDTGSNANKNEFGFFNTDSLFFEYTTGGSTQADLKTTQVFRDPSAWYHIVLAVDTTQATASNRIKMYVNGSQITSFSASTYPSQNTDMYINSTNVHDIGRGNRNSGAIYLDAYLTELNFIDGQALTPSSFGETSTTTGVWIPKKYTGTYGTNGFYLPFTDTTSTSTLGTDFSGNSNTWTVNNISLTAGSTYDSMNDVPTLTSATTANYCTWNPNSKGSLMTVTGGNLNASTSANGSQQAPEVGGTVAVSSGKWYWELTITASDGGRTYVGVGDGTRTGNNYGQNGYEGNTGYGQSTGTYGYFGSNGNRYQGDGSTWTNTTSAYGNTYTTNDVIGVALDLDNGKIWFSKNGTWQASGDPAAGTNAAFTSVSGLKTPLWKAYCDTSPPSSCAGNFGQQPFAYTPPTGFLQLNTFNLPTPTIGATAATLANEYMDVTLWPGNSGTQSITNSGSMPPDLVWIKNRTGANNHALFDSVRGATLRLYTDSTLDEQTEVNTLTAFNSNGFSLGSGAAVNASSNNYVGWQWRANGTGVSNTNGTITSTVSASTTAGFSIVTWTGNGANANIGHGLGVVPSMIITKFRSSTSNWSVYTTTTGAGSRLKLNLTDATAADGSFPTTPTSSIFYVNAGGNDNGVTQVAYCFAQVAGYSAFGSYTGNGDPDGPFIFTGFRPKFVMIKRTDSADHWTIQDTSRDTYNVSGLRLYPNQSVAEDTSPSSTAYIDMLSNGFKIRTSDSQKNASGGTYIYYAVAENPFKFSNAR